MSKKFIIFFLLNILLLIDFSFTEKQEKQEKKEEEKTYEYYDDEEYLKKTIKSYNYTNIIYYDDTNYSLILNKTEPTFILFYTPICHLCPQFIPIYIETANYCKEKNIEAYFTRIDSSISPNATDEYDVEEYPSIFFIYKEEKYKYDGIASKEEMLSFMEKKKNDDVYLIKKLSEIDHYFNKKKLLLMSTLKNKTSDLYDSFLNLARSSTKLEFISCESDECIKKYGEDVILFKTFDEKENSYLKNYGNIFDEINFNSVYDFVSIFSIETGAFLGPDGIDALIHYGKQALIYVRKNKDEKNKKDKYDSLFKKLGKELRFNNTYVFVSDLGETTGTNIGSAFSILPEELPGIFFYQQDTGDPYANVKIFSKRNLDMSKESKQSILNFIKDVNEGLIKRDLYSEAPSESKMDEGIKYVVGKTFDRDVLEEKNNVFLTVIGDEDYMEEEQNFLRTLKAMSKKYEDKNITFAYINISKNEPRDLDIWGVPLPIGFLYTNALDKKNVIKFVPKDNKDISEKEVVNFLEKNLKDYTINDDKIEDL